VFFVHSANDAGRWHPLREHLDAVGRLAGDFAGLARWAAEAMLAGRLHDLGKYADRFQARLHGKDSGLDHWSQGAWLALTEYRAVAAPLAIQRSGPRPPFEGRPIRQTGPRDRSGSGDVTRFDATVTLGNTKCEGTL
jgi:hypothetical protein